MSTYKPETVAAFKKMYAERKSTIEYMIESGNSFEKKLAMLIEKIATGAS